MKRLLLCLMLAGALAGCAAAWAAGEIPIEESTFPDANFRSRVTQLDTDGDGALSQAEIAEVTTLNLSAAKIADLTGIEHFTALRVLNCAGNQLTALDVRHNTALTELYCYGNQLTRLDVRYNDALAVLNCQNNRLSNLDLRFNRALGVLFCNGNHIAALDVSACPTLLERIRDDLFAEDGEDNTANYYREYNNSYYVYDIICDLGTHLSTGNANYTVVKLPADLIEIQARAFQSITADVVICPDGLETIGDSAFANCKALKEIHIPASVTAIADSAFSGCDDLVIVSGSAAIQTWAENHDILWKSE